MPGGLTGGGGGVALGVPHQQLVLQTAPAHALRTNQDQRLPLEGRDLRHLLVDPQLVAVKLWSRDTRQPMGSLVSQIYPKKSI